MKKAITIHPFLFALFPILFLYSYNKDQLPFNEVFLPSAIILGFTILAFFILWLIFKNNSKKSGIITTIFLILFFSYGRVYDVIKSWKIGNILIGRHRYLMIIWAILFILCVYFTIKTLRDLHHFTQILNVIGIVLIIFPLINIGIYKIKTINIEKSITIDVQEEYIGNDNQNNLPDIYYLIFDGYASSNTLKDVYNFDNGEFTEYLKEKGFYISNKSVSNYPTTFLSLASSLNMEYINYLSDVVGVESDDRTILYQMIINNKVMNFLKSRGYKFIHFSSGWGPTNYNQYADTNVAISYNKLNEFQTLLIQTTMITPFEKKFFEDISKSRIINTFDNLANIYKIEGKKFVFAHIVSPHPPYLFDENGKSVPEADFDMNDWGLEQKEYYLKQLIFINKEIEKLIDMILSNSEVSPIIIIQSDHGPHNTFVVGRYPTDDMFREGMRIFNAYYLPTKGNDLLYYNITPVNTFRLIFNSYFNTDYKLLDDHSYYSFEVEPYRFIDITNIVDYD